LEQGALSFISALLSETELDEASAVVLRICHQAEEAHEQSDESKKNTKHIEQEHDNKKIRKRGTCIPGLATTTIIAIIIDR
jgi:hypothetical protein